MGIAENNQYNSNKGAQMNNDDLDRMFIDSLKNALNDYDAMSETEKQQSTLGEEYYNKVREVLNEVKNENE